MVLGEEKAKEESRGALFFYLLFASGLVFWTRAMPTPFLPLVMAQEFGQSSTQIGMVMSSTPLGACMATPIAASLARNSRRIVYFHSVSLLFIAFTSLLMACLQRFLSTGDVFLAVTSICFTQGMAYALYMAANTTLISRRFTAVAYVVGMAEVAVGFGAQLGRLAGGALYDLGGFGCPFLSAAVCLTICGIIGFSFENRGIVSHGNRAADHADHGNHGDHGCEAKVPWKSFCCPGIWLATSGVFSAYMTTGLVDVTLPQHLESYLGPMPVTEVSAVSSLRSVVYLLTSWLCAQAMHAERAPLEPFLCFGFAFTILGMMTLRPLQWVVDVETAVFHQPPSRVVEWSCQIFSLVIASIGNAFMFIPGLPLMQSHVRHLGAAAAEQVSLLLMMAMFGGEFMGPIAGGALVQRFGLDATTAAFATALLPLFALTAAEIMREDGAPLTLETPLLRSLSPTEESQQLAENSSMPMDPESAYRFRRLAFLSTEGDASS